MGNNEQRQQIDAIWALVRSIDAHIEQIQNPTHFDDNGNTIEVDQSDLLGFTNTAILYMEAFAYTGSPKVGNTNTLHSSLLTIHNRCLTGEELDDSKKCSILFQVIGILKAMVAGIQSETFRIIAPQAVMSDILRTLYDIGNYPIHYIQDPELQRIVLRDLEELKRAVHNEMPKTVALLVGCILEAVLLSAVSMNRTIPSTYVPKLGRKFPDTFGIKELLTICIEQELLEKSLDIHAIELSNYRDLIHPNSERAQNTKLNDASISFGLSLLRRILEGFALSWRNGSFSKYEKK